MIYELIGYVNQVGMRLEGFKRVRDNVWNARCPICGDSQQRKGKQRFYIHPDKERTTLMTSCRNCSYASPFLYFLKDHYNDLYLQAIMDIFKNKAERKPKKVEQTVEAEVTLDETNVERPFLEPIEGLDNLHPVMKYVNSRYIPKQRFSRLAWCENFKEFSLKFPEYQENNEMPEDMRLLIPFYDSNNRMTHIQARAIDPNAYIRYITLKLDEKAPKWFGVESLKEGKRYVIEGPIDSLFLPNCVATADANLLSYPDGDIYIPDNQYRNKEIVQIVERIIDSGKSVVLFPSSFAHKDINDAVIDGVPLSEIYMIIKSNTFKGLAAKLEWSQRQKVVTNNGFKRRRNKAHNNFSGF